MQLFKTEMIFLHPPRTRPSDGARSRRVQRYGCRCSARTDTDAMARHRNDPVATETHRESVPAQPMFDVEWAA
jgi:hypothetical protein